MPLIEVTLGAGRSPAQIRAMIHELHSTVLRTAQARPEHIRVIVREVPRSHWATGDVTLHEMDAATGAQQDDSTDTTPIEKE